MNRPVDVIQAIRKRYTDMLSVLDERGRRLFVAAEARAYGLGGAYVVEQATGVARSTINRGIDDLKNVVDSATRGDPMSPLLWISRSLEHVTEALRGIGYALSTFVVRWTLKSLGYRLQANRKTHEGGKHPDAMHSFSTSKPRKRNSSRRGDRFFPSTPKRRSRLAITRTAAASCARKSRRNTSTSMILSIRRSVGQRLMAFTTSPKTKVGSASESVLTPRASR